MVPTISVASRVPFTDDITPHVTIDSSIGELVRLDVDINNDGDYDDAGELSRTTSPPVLHLGDLAMNRFFALCMILGLAMPLAGCDKKTEIKTERTVTTPEGTTTTTDSQKVETDKK